MASSLNANTHKKHEQQKKQRNLFTDTTPNTSTGIMSAAAANSPSQSHGGGDAPCSPFIIGDVEAQIVSACKRYDDMLRAYVGAAVLPLRMDEKDAIHVAGVAEEKKASDAVGVASSSSTSSPPPKYERHEKKTEKNAFVNSLVEKFVPPSDSQTFEFINNNAKGDKKGAQNQPFPMDFSALLYQSKAKYRLRVPREMVTTVVATAAPSSPPAKCGPTDGGNASSGIVPSSSPPSKIALSTTQSQRKIVEMYRSDENADGNGEASNRKETGEAAAESGGGDLLIPVDLDIMSLHRLIMPPSMEEDQIGAGGGGEGGRTITGHSVGQAIFEINWEGLLGALFPLTIAGKRAQMRRSTVTMKIKNHLSPKPLLPHSFNSVGGWKALRYDGHITDRYHYSYAALLVFYGWRLHDEGSGEVDRHRTWRERYQRLQMVQKSCDHNVSSCPSDVTKKSTATYSASSILPLPHPPRFYYLSLTVALQSLLELKLFPYAARLLLFLLEEFAAGRLRWLVDRRGDWFDCGGGVEGDSAVCRWCGETLVHSQKDGQGGAASLSSPHRPCRYLMSMCFLGSLPSAKRGVDADRDGDESDSSSASSSSSDSDVRPQHSSPSSSSSSSKPIDFKNLSLFDDVWSPMVTQFNFKAGNCYDGAGSVGRIAKKRAALDASDSE